MKPDLTDNQALIQQILTLQTEVNALREDRAALLMSQDEQYAVIEDLNIHKEELRVQNETLEIAQEAIQELESSYHSLFEHAPTGYVVIDVAGRVIDINKVGLSLLKRDTDNFCRKHFNVTLNKYDRQSFHDHLRQAFSNPERIVRGHFRIKDTEPQSVLLLESWVTANSPHCRTSMTDISELLGIKQNLQLTRRILEEMHEGVMIADHNLKIIFVNHAFSEVTGYTQEEVIGKTPTILSSGRHDKYFYQSLWQKVNQIGFWRGEIWNKRKNGEVYPEWLSINRIYSREDESEHYIAVFTDITDRKTSELKLIQMAHYDLLTDLPNRFLLRERTQQAMNLAKRENGEMCLLFIDLDKFKKINDTYGHQEGDWVLQEVATRMQTSVRDNDTLARLGGDEFAMVINAPTSELNALAICQRIIDLCEQPITIEQRTHHISASIGIAIYPHDGLDLDTLLRHADIAMYEVKTAGRGRAIRYQHDHEAELIMRQKVEYELRDAISAKRVSLVYQPQVLSVSGQLVGFEALVRIYDQQGKTLMPMQFIPIAEETGLIIELSQQITHLALAQQRQWIEQGHHPVKLSINLSVAQLRQANFAQNFTDLVNAYALDPSLIGVEITESMAMDNYNQTLEIMKTLRNKGFSIAIDDFGAGHSSLTHLKQLPFDLLKIDKAFIDDTPHDEGSNALVKSIIDMAKGLHLDVIAEGVESQAQLDWLKGQRCNMIQGYIFSRPLNVEDATCWLGKQTTENVNS
jgi:diguanylate cyclase (GGDEF)-like protein/PAS domain S-box-containing protein